ncbi:ATP-binding protein [Brevundimonas staleyi]|uniref:histidine kinase n=1 Tax=Brevundimonas staleyi TaxID=74326 RepID=A0ABW0FRU0_9CAUL
MADDTMTAPTGLDTLQFCLATEHSPIGTALVGLDGSWLNVNAALRNFLGYRAEEFAGLTFQDITDAADLDADLALLEQLLAGEIPSYQMEKRYVRKDGQRVWARLTVSLVRDEAGAPLFFISHVQDISAKKAGEAERQRLTDRATLAVQAARIGIWEWELETNALSWSPEMFDLFRVSDPGRPIDFEFFGRNLHEDDREPLNASIAAALETGALDTEFRIRCLDGDIRIIKVLAKVYRTTDGRAKRLIGANWDITEARNLALRAEAASRAKSQFLAVMSHEIRTPMNGILGMTQAMRADDLPAVQRERLDVIAECGDSLLTILNDILDLSKVEAGKLEIEAVPFDLRRVLTSVVAGYAPSAEDRGLDLTLDLDAADGLYLGDPTRVRQILTNLVSNALKFTERGGVSLKARRTAEGLRLEVADTGKGMDDETLGRIFKPFAQEDASTTRRFGGTGLGLSIVRQLAVLMGGDVAVSSRPGFGSRFTVDLPAEYLGEVVEAAEEIGGEIEQGAAIRILAAEDNLNNQLVLKTLLGQMGVDVTLVADGEQAVEAWRREAWDVVLMDVQMPVLDGFGATQRIRAMEAAEGRARTPVIALTANAMDHHRAECLAVGMDGLVAKPLDIRLLITAIEAAVSGVRTELAA